MSKSLKSLCFLVGLGLLGGAAEAASMTYALDQNNAGLADDIFATVMLSEMGDDIYVKAEVDTDAFAAYTPGANFGMDQFFFNHDGTTTVSAANIMLIDPTDWNILEDKNAGGGYGFFQFELKGDGNSRTTTLEFKITGVAGDSIATYAVANPESPTSDQFFAAHVGGFEDGPGSVKIAGSTPVPLPGAVWLFGTGLVGLAGLSRRRKA